MHDTPKKRMYKANLSCVIGATAINCYYKHTHSATSWIIRGKEKDMKKITYIYSFDGSAVGCIIYKFNSICSGWHIY